MPKVIHCPSCKQPILDDTGDVVEQAMKPLLEAIKALPGQFPKGEPPPELTKTLEAVAKAGQNMEKVAQDWEIQRKAEAEAHIPPSTELVEHWKTCTTCSPAWQKIWDGIADNARQGYIPAGQAKTAISEVARQLTGAGKGNQT